MLTARDLGRASSFGILMFSIKKEREREKEKGKTGESPFFPDNRRILKERERERMREAIALYKGEFPSSFLKLALQPTNTHIPCRFEPTNTLSYIENCEFLRAIN